MTQDPIAQSDIRVTQQGAVCEIVLNRPQARNALTTAMRAEIAQALPRAARDPQTYAVVVRSGTDGVFCAGGDIREITAWAKTDPQQARRSLREEYSLNWLHECFSKPTISLIDGLVVGSGVGITAYGTHRVAGEGYRFAMPETSIGLFPDDGVAWLFARLPDEIGVYLGLTGRAIGRADAYALGLVTHCISQPLFVEIATRLADAWPVDPILDDLHRHPGPAPIESHRASIARCFNAPSVTEIIARLRVEQGADAEWARGVAADLERRAPLSLAVTLRHIRQAGLRDLRETLIVDYRLACRFLEDHDFTEGVRALLIDKDHAPRWQPAGLSEVTAARVDAYFTPRHGDELELASRARMQSARV